MAASRRRRGAHGDEEHENDERWLLTYADMITLLMALFMVLFSISSVNISKYVTLQHSLQDAFSGRILPGGRALAQAGGSTTDPHLSDTPPAATKSPMTSNDNTASAQAQGQAQAQAQAVAAAKAEQADFKALKARVDAYVKRHGLATRVSTLITRDGLVIRLLTDRLLFASGSAAVQPAGRPLLAKVGQLLRAENQHEIRVRGYTDPVPIHTTAFPSNWELSAARAASVVRAFIGAGVAPPRLEAAGRADLDPLTTNATADGRARNRRVEVLLPRTATGQAADKAAASDAAKRPRFAPEFGPESLK
jgi:chemotaxis protein MotB